MATVQNSIQLYDGASSVLRKINSSINITSESFRNLQMSAGNSIGLPGLRTASSALGRMEVQFEQVEEVIVQTRERQIELNKSIEKGEKKSIKLKDIWNKISSGLGKIGVAASPEEIFTQANSVKAAGNIIQSQTGMQGQGLGMAKQSAKKLYIDNISDSPEDAAKSLSVVNQMTGQTGASLEQLTRAGLLMQDTFGYGLTDSISSAGVLEKQFGASGAEAFDLVIQATQAGLNKNGELLDTINEYSAQFKSLGFGGADMFNMLINGAQSGEYSVSTLGEAIKEFSTRAVGGGKDAQEGFTVLGLDANKMTEAFGSGGETAKQAFQQTIDALSGMEDPVSRNIAGMKLFGSAWGELGNEGIMALSDLSGSVDLSTEHLEELNNVKYDDAASALSSLAKTVNMGLGGAVGGMVDNVTRAINNFTAGLQGDVSEISGIFGVIGFVAGVVGSAISDNWSIIEPVLWGIIAALIVYNATSGLSWLTTLKEAAALAWKTICDWAETAAIIAMIAAQDGLNAAFAACPLTWIIILIIILIALFYAGVAAVNQFAGTSYSATGLICGAFAVAGAFIANSLMGILEIGLGIIEYFYNGWVAFANFFGNLFNDPVSSIIYLFADLADGVLNIIQKVAKALDFVFGSHLEDTVQGWRDGLSDIADELAEKYGNGTYEVKAGNLDMDQVLADIGFSPERFGYEDSAQKWYAGGAGAEDNVKKGFEDIKETFDRQNQDPGFNPSDMTDSINQNTGDTAMNTAAMTDSMDIMDEELKYMRDAAEQEIINRFTLAELKVDMNNNNTIKTQTDITDMARMLSDVTAEMLTSAAEGVNI
ncbi:phage tail tape measure protein [Clostridium sp. Marseille-P2415]|uniref:phage tail tape measure protein n=1 Tax=Clostridium sp. Marseille-P2415 TaxID=1805471 RepID=UPI0009887D74|nr:phage tail tape measure protein [Clostridium sp. Marseille-P2415]